MCKANVLQRDVITICKDELDYLSVTNDIHSPSHYTDIEGDLSNHFLDIKDMDPKRDALIRAMHDLYAAIADLSSCTLRTSKSIVPSLPARVIRTDVLMDAIRIWGTDSQIGMIQEEAMELALAIQHSKRWPRKKSIEAIIDELADMHIMLAQADIIFDVGAINDRIHYKMERLAQRIRGTKLSKECPKED